MPGGQLADPVEDRPQELVEGRERQVGFRLGGAHGEGGVSPLLRQLRAGSQQGALAHPGISGEPHGAATLGHVVDGRLDLSEFGVPADQERRP
jgi:hypothetical protein